MRGLQIPEALIQLQVSDSPVVDLGAISRLTEVSSALWFDHTALQSAAGLERVARVDQLQWRIAGNLGETLPLLECPWTGDGICDDVQHPYGVCAEGTDPDCVGRE